MRRSAEVMGFCSYTKSCWMAHKMCVFSFGRIDIHMQELQRYSVILGSLPREMVLLRGTGCSWARCAFCDYYLDQCSSAAENFALNRRVLAQVTGKFQHVEVINSGSFCELDDQTLRLVEQLCIEKKIRTLHFECHWMHREKIPALRARYAALGVTIRVRLGLETFDHVFRETVLHKGIAERDSAKIAAGFDECNLLFGLSGQTLDSMRYDVEMGLQYFDRLYINLMTPNTAQLQPDPAVCALFTQQLYPLYREHPRMDILLINTDFGVG